MDSEILINEGGINWTWFTRIRLEPDDTVTILEHYRKHNTEQFTTEEKNVIRHPKYYGSDMWEEGKGRVAIRYNVPELGWKLISNPKYIFDYTKEKPITKEEAKGIIEQIAEEKKAALDILSIVEKSADIRLKEINPECYSIREQIYDKGLFDRLTNKIEEKKKLTNYPNARTKEERKIHNTIQTLEQTLHNTYQIPLFKMGLAENLGKGFEWLIDDIILSYAAFDSQVKRGESAARELFPSEENHELSSDAKEFSSFFKCERDDYKIFAIEFIKKMCGK